MLEPTNSHGGPSRRWLPEEMHLMNARDLGRHGHPATGPRLTPRVVRRIPTLKRQAEIEFAADWKGSNRWTRDLMRELIRLGYSGTQVGEDGRVYVTGVGRTGFALVLTADLDATGLTVRRVTFGRDTWTCRQAVRWLKSRAAR